MEGFFLRKYMRILLGHWKLSVIERCPYQEVRLYSETDEERANGLKGSLRGRKDVNKNFEIFII